MGLAALFTMVGGRGDGVTGRLMRQLVSSGFSRQQELAADEEALRVLTASDIDPKALADALRRTRREGDDPAVLQYVSTHPGFDERVQLSDRRRQTGRGRRAPIEPDWNSFDPVPRAPPNRLALQPQRAQSHRKEGKGSAPVRLEPFFLFGRHCVLVCPLW